MTKKKYSLAQGCAIVALCAIAGPTFAQTAQPQAAPQSTTPSSKDDVTEVIITATPTVGGVKKMDAAFSEVSLSQNQLKESGLTSSSDVLKSSPGAYIESSGGPGGGANVEVTGFPSNSGAPYATFELNGASMFPMAGQVYLDGDVLLRTDETLQRVELVQGGPAVLYGDGQPGLTANYILKRGTQMPTGDIGVTYGSEGYERVDAFYSGPVSKSGDLTGTVGGYWNTGRGIRNPQYTADQGGQLTATLTKKWDSGSLMVYGRYFNLDDEFVTDTPILLTNTDGKWQTYPGFNPLTGTMSSKADQYLSLPIGPCTGTGCSPVTKGLNQQDGRGVLGGSFGGEYHYDFGNGVQILDDFNVTRGVAHMSALYSSPVNPESLQTFVTAKESADHLTGITGVTAYYTNNGAAVPLTQNIMEAEVRSLRETFHSESNEVHLSWEAFDGNTLTIGNRTSLYGINELYYTGADILLQAQDNPTPIGVNLTDGTNTWQLTNSQGFANGATGIQADYGHGVNVAFFLSDSWKWNNFLFDAGVRDERQIFDEFAQNSASTNLTGNTYDLWGTGKYLVPGTTLYHYDRTAASWTVGLNYEFTSDFSAYVRANKGVHFLAFSDVTGLPVNNDGPMQTAYNYQSGVKYKSSFIYADVSAFYRTFRNVPVQITGIPIPGTTTTGTGTIVYGSNTPGLEYSLVLNPFRGKGLLDGFTLSMMGDFMQGKYTQSNGCIYYTGGATPVTYCVAADNFTGYLLARQPTFQTRITPAYKTDTSWGTLNFWANYEYVGKHYSDMLEDDNLGTYYDLSAGVSGTVGEHWEWTLSGTNLTNQIGITEENPRVTFGSVPSAGPQLARSIDGREINLQIKYKY